MESIPINPRFWDRETTITESDRAFERIHGKSEVPAITMYGMVRYGMVRYGMVWYVWYECNYVCNVM